MEILICVYIYGKKNYLKKKSQRVFNCQTSQSMSMFDTQKKMQFSHHRTEFYNDFVFQIFKLHVIFAWSCEK